VVKRKNRKIADSNTHGGNKRKALAKLLEKIISDGKLRGVVASSMSLILYEFAGPKLGGAEVVEGFNLDSKLTVPQQVKALKLMIKNVLRLNTGPKRANLRASLVFLLLFFYFTNTRLYLVFIQLFRQLIAEGGIEKELLRGLM